tara:strand:+ start:631 stop:1398 length:768 start_codon:yes stop_codon:yes gene_type:complete
MQADIYLIIILFFFIAILYSSVGFGGGSSYLAILSLVGLSFFFIRTNALLCNLVVVSGSVFLFYRDKWIVLKEVFPFIVTSVPMTFLGSLLKMKESVFFIILGIALILSSLALIWKTLQINIHVETNKKYSNYFSYLLGAFIGFISGIVGIGGGIFLAPILNHLRWGKPMKIAALTALFIFANSISGVIGLLFQNTFVISLETTIPLLLVVFFGGQIGVRFTLKNKKSELIKIITGILVFVVGLRILIIKGLLFL